MSELWTTSKPVAADDLRIGDYVAVTHQTFEFVRLCDSVPPVRVEKIPVEFLACDDGEPLRVRGISLPFVLVRNAEGGGRTLDLRQCRLARLPKAFGKEAFRVIAPSKHKTKRKGKKKRGKKGCK